METSNLFLTVVSFCCLLTVRHVACQSNPCPRLLIIEPNSPEPDRWYGAVTLISDSDLSGVWLRMIFDRPSLQLGNWFGEVVTTDNKEYLIKNPKHQLLKGTPTSVRFYIKYNRGEPVPNLLAFRLNAKTVCPEGTPTTPPPTISGQLQTSNELAGPPAATTVASNIGGIAIVPPVSEEDDFFQGDFSIFNRPQQFKPITQSADVKCGTIAAHPRPLITYGQATREGQFPWHAALYHTKGIDLAYICGASLISNLHVITVAHCVTKRKSQQALQPENLVVYLGKYFLKRWSNSGIQDKQVAAIIPHPQYNSRLYSNDIAIIKLANPAEFTDYVRPICLWSDTPSFSKVVNKEGVVVGWGFDETGKVTEALTQAKMPVVSKETCIYSFPEFYSKFTTQKTYCAGFRNGTSVCNGDSGGGMVFVREGSSPQNPVYEIRGLVSISVALQNQSKCDASHYVVFTDVAQYLDWIRAVMSSG